MPLVPASASSHAGVGTGAAAATMAGVALWDPRPDIRARFPGMAGRILQEVVMKALRYAQAHMHFTKYKS